MRGNDHLMTFGELAVELYLAAQAQAEDITSTEILAAKLPKAPGLEYTIELMRQRATALAQAHQFFKRHADDEDAIRMRAAGLVVRRDEGRAWYRRLLTRRTSSFFSGEKAA